MYNIYFVKYCDNYHHQDFFHMTVYMTCVYMKISKCRRQLLPTRKMD